MALPVYTVEIYSGVIASASTHLIGFPPAGYVWDLRDIQAYNGTTPQQLPLQGLTVFDSTGGTIWQPRRGWVQPLKSLQWQGRHLIPAATSLSVETFDDVWAVHITGYQLSLTG